MFTSKAFKNIIFAVIGFLTMSFSDVNAQKAEAIFAGGCFWCLQPPFDALPGVLETKVGYSGGAETPTPTYESVSSGQTEHVEVLKVTYDSSRLTYETLLEVFWKNIDPLDGKGQFCDKGNQYRSALFYANDQEKKAAEASLEEVHRTLGQPIKTLILPRKTFFKAEDYHQDYYKKNPLRYKFYRFNCGRDKRLEAIWGKE